MAAEVARKVFGVRHVVARLYNPARERTYQQLDLDYVCGTTLVAATLLDKIMAGHGHHLSNFGGIELVEFKSGPAVVGRRVRDIEIEHGFRVAAIARGKASFIPEPETKLEHGDVLMAAVRDEAFGKVKRYMEGAV
jgi:trk system potassium uptake protein TrkA